jgi:hypothetical protein
MPRQFVSSVILSQSLPPNILCILETQISKDHVEALASSLGYDKAFGVGSDGWSDGLCIF